MAAALFQDSTANSLAVAAGRQGSNVPDTLTQGYVMIAATTSPTTFTIRAGGTAGTFTLNGGASTGFYNGTLYSWIVIKEIMG